MSIRISTALENYRMTFLDAADTKVGKTGLNVSVAISKNNGSYTTATNSPATEIGSGDYGITLTATELNVGSVGVIAAETALSLASEVWRDHLYPSATPAAVDALGISLTTVSSDLTSVKTKVDSLVGPGEIVVNEDTGGVDNLRVLDGDSSPIENAEIWAYLKSDYDAGNTGNSYIKAWSRSGVDGRWQWPVYLEAETYTVVVDSEVASQAFPKEVTVA